TPVEQVRWVPLQAGGYTDLGAALTLLSTHLTTPPMEERALPPALVLVSDGQPTDDLEAGLARLVQAPFGAAAVRLAVAIGADAAGRLTGTCPGTSLELGAGAARRYAAELVATWRAAVGADLAARPLGAPERSR